MRKVSFQTVCSMPKQSLQLQLGKKNRNKKVLNRQLEVKLVACQVAHLERLFQFGPFL